MGAKEKDKSLLEVSIALLTTKHKPQPIMQIAKETMELKGLKTAAAKAALPQFLADFMESGYFVYCGDGLWDLKERQSTAVLDKDGTDYEVYAQDDEEVKKNELKDDEFDYNDNQVSSLDDDDSSDDSEDDDDISTLLSENLDDGEDGLSDSVEVEAGYEEDEGEEE